MLNSNVGKLNIPELKDAKLAGTRFSESCTLILTEGYSAKEFAVSYSLIYSHIFEYVHVFDHINNNHLIRFLLLFVERIGPR